MKIILLKIIAVGWLISGILGVIWPEKMRRYLYKKIFKRYRRLSFVALLLLGGYLISFFRQPQAVSKIVALLGVAVVIKAFFLLGRRFGENLDRGLDKVPLLYFRLASLLLTAAAVFLLWFK